MLSAFVRSLAVSAARDDCVRARSVSSSPSAKNSSQDSPDSSRWPLCLHRLGIFDQPDCGGKLRVLYRRGHARCCLSMCDVRGHFENLFREIIDAIEEAASACDENSSAQVIDEWFVIEPAFEQLKSLAQAQMNNC